MNGLMGQMFDIKTEQFKPIKPFKPDNPLKQKLGMK